MSVQSALLASMTGALALGLPALLLALATCLRDAPAEWARGALIAWSCLAAILVAGAASGAIAHALLAAMFAGAFLALIVGGPWGLTIIAAVCASVLGAQLVAQDWLVHWLAMPAVTAGAALGAVRSMTQHRQAKRDRGDQV